MEANMLVEVIVSLHTGCVVILVALGDTGIRFNTLSYLNNELVELSTLLKTFEVF
jgi:hypothetical protein